MDDFKWYDSEIQFNDSEYFWKYLDIHKFLNLLLNQQITLSRLDLFEDPLEGITVQNLDVLHSIKDAPKRRLSENSSEDPQEKYARYWKKARKTQRKKYASCWFLSEKESWAMWNLYSNSDSIVLCAKPQLLIEKMNSGLRHVKENLASNLRTALMGNVEYLPLWPFDRSTMEKAEKPDIHSFKKDISFQHENEFRFILDFKQELDAEIITLEVAPENLSIFTHPNMVDWKFENLKTLISTLKIDLEIRQSTLSI